MESQVMKDWVGCKEVQKADYRSEPKSIEWTAARTRAVSKIRTLSTSTKVVSIISLACYRCFPHPSLFFFNAA